MPFSTSRRSRQAFMLYYGHKCSYSPKSAAVAWLEKEHKSPAEKKLLRLMVRVSLGHGDTGQRKAGNRCLGKIRSKKPPFSPYLASYLHSLARTQPGSSLQALIAHGHDLGCQVRDRSVPEWQGDPVLEVCPTSSLRCGAAGDDQVWWQRERAYANVKAHRKRSSEAGAGELAPCRQGSQTGLCSACLRKVYLACLGPGCFTASLVPAVFNHRKIIHGHVEKTLFCPLFLWKSIYPLRYSGTFPGTVTMLDLNNTVCLADFKQLWYKRLFNCIFFCC